MLVKQAFFRTLAVAAVFAVASSSLTAQTTQRSRQVTRGNVIAALNNIDANISRLNALNNLTVQKVRVVNVSNLFNKNNVSALNNALNKNNVCSATMPSTFCAAMACCHACPAARMARSSLD